MNNNKTDINLKYLEDIQKECLQMRFGDSFESDFKKLESNNGFDIEAYFKSQPSLTEQDKNKIRISYEKSKQSFVPQTKYESIYSYPILKTLFDKIEATAKRLSLNTEIKPIIGTALSKQYNAFAHKVPITNDYLIVFEGELFTLSNILAKIIALCLPDFKISKQGVSFNLKENRIKNHIKSNESLQIHFEDFVLNAILHGQPNKTKHFYLNETFSKLHYELLTSLELFVVGHEYGHIYCGHLNENNIIKQLYENKPIERISPDWEMEYEADYFGLTLMLNTLKSNSLFPFSFLGPELFFTFLDIEERANNLLINGVEKRSYGCDTHPPTFERRTRIRQLISKGLPARTLETYKYVSDFLENVMESLWEDFKERHGIKTPAANKSYM
nr:hypothetical protein [uncultured Draconibacterium sp.]